MQIRPKTNSTEVTGAANQTTNRNPTNKREPGVPLGTRSPGAAGCQIFFQPTPRTTGGAGSNKSRVIETNWNKRIRAFKQQVCTLVHHYMIMCSLNFEELGLFDIFAQIVSLKRKLLYDMH